MLSKNKVARVSLLLFFSRGNAGRRTAFFFLTFSFLSFPFHSLLHRKMSNFRQTKVKTIMEEVLREKLTGATYHPDNTSQWTREIADEIKQSLKLQDMDRYKYVVQVMIGEQRGEGVSMSARCFWDQKRDHYVQKTFQNVRKREKNNNCFLSSSTLSSFRLTHFLLNLAGNNLLRRRCVCSFLLLRVGGERFRPFQLHHPFNFPCL